ncbi:MAG: hypothetical protein BAJALOKI1v1_1290005 [Promethearchaeota archaeon]|nr:MAG: hypothetical protein BAJALOKI1v1_1290005 [Candidatus Lokiarchaeota archaeon]
MENIEENNLNSRTLIKQYYKADYGQLFNKIKSLRTPVKNKILQCLLDGNWHSELEIIRIAKKEQPYIGAVTIGTMIHNLNHVLKNDYVEKRMREGKMYYKLADNYVGLTRAAYSKYKHKEFNINDI